MDKAIEKLNLQLAIEAFKKEFRNRSFSQRNLALGRMVNCQVCDRRHRSSDICTQRHVVELTPPEGLTDLTRNQLFGAARVKGKRVNPHYSAKRLQLVELTRALYPEHAPFYQDPINVMKMARREARELLEDKRNAKRDRRRRMQDVSRRINNGLLSPGSR